MIYSEPSRYPQDNKNTEIKKLDVLLMKIDARQGSPVTFNSRQDYFRKVAERITLLSNSKK